MATDLHEYTKQNPYFVWIYKTNPNETPTVRGLAANNNNKLIHGNYDLLMK